MRSLIATIVLFAACSNPPSAPEIASPHDPGAAAAVGPVADLHFNDRQLQAIAVHLRREAQLRGIETSPGRNRVERLLSLETSIRGSGLALARVNKLVAEMTATDVSQWAKLRQRAERDFARCGDDAARRVCDLLARWQRRKAAAVFRYLSSNYTSTYITSLEWERRFHEFVTERPIDAATWGWMLSREYAAEARQQYGRGDAESAYRFYLELSGLSDGREARRMFSVPGIDVVAPAKR